MEIVDVICADASPVEGNGKIRCGEQPIIESIKIRAVKIRNTPLRKLFRKGVIF